MKFLARFPFNALVLADGGRKPRREVLFGIMEYDVREIAKADMERDAVRISDAWIYADPQRYRTRALRTTSYWGWDGGLWAQPLHDHPLDAESLRHDLDFAHPLSGAEDSPFSRLLAGAHGRDWTGITMENSDTHKEETFRGEILSSDRDRAVASRLAACRDVVIADGELLTRRREPTLVVADRGNPGIGIMPWAEHPVPLHIFRLDRLEEAREWAASLRKPDALSGRIVAMDPRHLHRDDLSHHVVNWLPHLIGKEFVKFLPCLGPDSLATWHRLAAIEMSALAAADRPLPDDLTPEAAVSMLRGLACSLEYATVPADYREARDELLGKPFASFFRRTDLELARRPPTPLHADDEAAISTIRP